jgi:glutaredoxin
MAKVKMYTLSTCPWCMKTKKFFKDNKIPFEYIDYDLASEAEQKKLMKELETLGSTGGFPVVVIEENVVLGYNPDAYKQLLKLK